jgi:lipopolysaccharide/colanic/teichoic acid biosynthesis glycosyltransferase
VFLLAFNRVCPSGVNTPFKTVLDYALTIPGLLALSPLLALIALAVRLDSPGPALYRRRVLGVGGRPFDAFKFRTMYVDGDRRLAAHPELLAELRANHKLKDDPRITRVGRLLRKLSLDELPQLINVLLGQMSLVGPRMIAPPELENYGQWGAALLTVRPGLTGLWQISGRADVSYQRRVQLDMEYIRNRSLWLDVRILLRTLPAVIGRKGAY